MANTSDRTLVAQFFVKGEPRAKQSFRSTGRGRGYTPARIKAWQADVGWAAQEYLHGQGKYETFAGPFIVVLVFRLGDRRRIDLDNLSKAVLDGLNGIVWEDDRDVINLNLWKEAPCKEPGVEVTVWRKEEVDG